MTWWSVRAAFVLATSITLQSAPSGLLVSEAHAQTADSASVQPVRRIMVEGNQRIAVDTILSYMEYRRDEEYDAARIDAALKKLFQSGLFADVSMRREGDRLIVSVIENPVINRVAYEGNKAIKEEDLTKELQLKPRTIYTRAKVQADVSRIVELYRRSGRFAAIIEPKVIRLPQNRVDLVYEITEGEKTKIAAINFLGNKEFSDGSLRDVISTAESAWWKFFSSSDNYDPDRLNYDRELLRRYYLSEGYADFRVISAVADLSRDNSKFYITFTVEEGDVYDFGKIDLSTKLEKLDKGALEKLIVTKEGDRYNATQIDQTIDALAYAAGTQGYAFAEVRPRVKRDKKTRKVEVTYTITEGPRVYIERINIHGNTRTLDKVIRRQMRVAEGDAYNKVLIDRSEKKIRQLEYFSKVELTREPGSAPDKTVLNVAVQEQSTGSFSVSFGFSSVDKALVGVSLSEQNFLGRGLQISTAVSFSARQKMIQAQYTDPYFLDRDLVGGIDLFGTETDYQDEASFDSRTRGFGFRFGFPLSEKTRFLMRYQFRRDEIFNVTSLSPIILAAQGKETRSIIGYDFYYDDRNDPIAPTGGYDLLLSQDFSGAGGTVRYLSSQILAHAYMKLADNFIMTQRLDMGYIYGIGEAVRLNDRYFKGGDDFRGFRSGGIGPRDILSRDAIGGEAYAFATTEVTVPNGIPENFGIKTSVFVDYGFIGKADIPAVLAAATDVRDNFGLRASAGISFNWKSPFGPVKVNLAKAFKKESYDRTEIFSFSAGTAF